MRINSAKCSFVGVARCFDFSNFIPENKKSQQYVLLNVDMRRTLVF